MTVSLRNAVLSALAVIHTVDAAAKIPVRVADILAPVLHRQAACAGNAACTCQVLRATFTGANATLLPSDGAAYSDFEDEN